MHLQGVLETCLYVDDLAQAERFYIDVLGLDFVSRQEGRHLFLRCGGQMVLLFNPLASRQAGDDEIPTHGCFGPGHAAFAVGEADLPAWTEHLERRGVGIEKVHRWPSGGQSIYFRDPAGNSLELATPRLWGLSPEKTNDLDQDHS
jgi:catechol 2,3-dioxygenase-like lactoylglutathione lyase family enzyme